MTSAAARAAITAARSEAAAALRTELSPHGLDGDLDAIAAEVELDPLHAHLRRRVRAHLVDDLARQRDLLAPLTRLYER